MIVFDMKFFLIFVIFINLNLVINADKIKLDKIFTLDRLVEYFIHQRKKVPILNSEIIKTLIIYLPIIVTIQLLIVKYSCIYRKFRGSYKPSF